MAAFMLLIIAAWTAANYMQEFRAQKDAHAVRGVKLGFLTFLADYHPTAFGVLCIPGIILAVYCIIELFTHGCSKCF